MESGYKRLDHRQRWHASWTESGSHDNCCIGRGGTERELTGFCFIRSIVISLQSAMDHPTSSCLVLGYGFRGRRIERCHFRLARIHDDDWPITVWVVSETCSGWKEQIIEITADVVTGIKAAAHNYTNSTRCRRIITDTTNSSQVKSSQVAFWTCLV